MSEPHLESLRIDSDRKVRAVRRRRLGLWFAISGAVVLLLLIALTLTNGSAKTEFFTVPTPEAGEPVLLTATGYIVAKDPISLSPEVTGRVLFVGPDVGETVAAGQVLALIDTSTYATDLSAARAEYERARNGPRPDERARSERLRDEAEALSARASDELARAEKLYREGAVSQLELERLQHDAVAAAARADAMMYEARLAEAGTRREEIEIARSRWESAKLAFDRATMRSPISGLVVKRDVRVGGYVIAGQGVGLRDMSTPPPYVVADLSRMEAIVEVAEREITRVRTGMPAIVRPDALPDSAFQGVIDRITPFAYRQKGTIELRVKILNPSPLLKHEMNARIEFTERPTKGDRPSMRIPVAALRDDQQGAFVLVADDEGVLRRRSVKAAPSGEEMVVITEGLKGGERIVLDANLKDGDRTSGRPESGTEAALSRGGDRVSL